MQCLAGSCVSRCQPACASGQACSDDGLCLGEVVWRYPRPGTLGDSNLAVADDGTVLFASLERDDAPAMIHALSPDGQLLWQRELPIPALAPFAADRPTYPVLGPDGTIYISTFSDLTAFSPDGQTRWRVLRPGGTSHSNEAPTVGSDGTVYWGRVAALGPDGSVRWKQGVGRRNFVPIFSLSAERTFSTAGIFDVGSVALGPEGDVAWTMNDDHMADVVAVTSSQTFARVSCRHPRDFPFFWGRGCGDVRLFDINSGEQRWHSPGIDQDVDVLELLTLPGGSILVRGKNEGNSGSTLFWKLDAAGKLMGPPVSIPVDAYGGAALGDDGTLYVSRRVDGDAGSGGVVAVDPSAGTIVWSHERPGLVFPGFPAVGAGGCVLVVIQDLNAHSSEVVCLRSASKGLAATTWPATMGGNHAALRPNR